MEILFWSTASICWTGFTFWKQSWWERC